MLDELTPEELVIVAKMLDWYMRAYLYTLSSDEQDAGWKFLAIFLPINCTH
jgi:hypothetical protein